MPEVYLTKEDRVQARYEARSKALALGLAAYKFKHQYTNKQVAEEVGVSTKVVAALLGRREARVPPKVFFRLLDMAELDLKPRERAL